MANRPIQVVVFGVGAHGRAAFRALRRQPERYSVVGFLDNDPNKQGSAFAGVPIYSPDSLVSASFDVVAVAGRQVERMCRQLVQDLHLPEAKILRLKRSEIAASDQEIDVRSKDTDQILQFVTGMLLDLGVSYWIDASSLLALHRGSDLSRFSDVDVTIVDFARIDEIVQALEQTDYVLEKVGYPKQTAITQKGRLYKLVISSRVDVEYSEPACIDIICKAFHNGAYLMPFGDRFLYTPEQQLSRFDTFSYHALDLRIPDQAVDYLSLIYGGNWQVPAEFWSDKDYGNLTDL